MLDCSALGLCVIIGAYTHRRLDGVAEVQQNVRRLLGPADQVQARGDDMRLRPSLRKVFLRV
jgi:hypothetical protein